MTSDDKRDRSPRRDKKGGDDRRRGPQQDGPTKPDPRRSDESAFRAPRGLSPAKIHGTRVKFNIVCARCGKEDTLPFVPRTKGELLCHVCAEDVFGEDWAHGRQVDYAEEHFFVCVRCGRKDFVRFRPRPDKELLCRACLRGDEQPSTERLKGMKKVD